MNTKEMKEMKEMESKIASKTKLVSGDLINVLWDKYGIANVHIGHTRYAPDGTIEHECAVHVEYLDGRTICITDAPGGMEEKKIQRLANAVREGWMALHRSPAPGKEREPEFCQCDPDVGATPCEYCALHGALAAADMALRELSGRTISYTNIQTRLIEDLTLAGVLDDEDADA